MSGCREFVAVNRDAPARSTVEAMSFAPSLQTLCDELLDGGVLLSRAGRRGQISGPGQIAGQISGPGQIPGQISGPVQIPGQISGQIPRKNAGNLTRNLTLNLTGNLTGPEI